MLHPGYRVWNDGYGNDDEFDIDIENDDEKMTILMTVIEIRPPDKSAYWKIIFFISHPKHFVGTQKNRLNETVLLTTQNTCLN